MRRIVRSPGYARMRLGNGAVFGLLGVAIIVRTVVAVGQSWAIVPGLVLGAAMIALAAVRFRDYRDARRRP